MSCVICPVTSTDIDTLQQISRTTFKTTFDCFTDPLDMEHFLETKYEKKKLLQELDDPNSQFFFLKVDSKVAGYLKVNEGSAQTEHIAHNAFEVERIYLLNTFQHKGFGELLLNHAEKIARSHERSAIWLGVYEHNTAAQHFYHAHGFTQIGKHIFPVGDDPQVDLILIKNL